MHRTLEAAGIEDLKCHSDLEEACQLLNGEYSRRHHNSNYLVFLTLPMLRLLSFKAKGCKDF